MTDSFEAWINSMSEEDYEFMLDADSGTEGFSASQYQKAINIRTPASEEDLEMLQREQESEVTEVQTERTPRQPRRVYDNRDAPPIPRYVVNERGDSAIILPKQDPKLPPPIISTSNVEQSRTIQKRSIIDRLKSFFKRK